MRAEKKSIQAFLAILGVMCCVVVVNRADAQAARSSSSNAQAVAQLQQLAAERTQLQSENARLRQELEALKKGQASLTSERDAAARRARNAEVSVQANAAQREASERDMQAQRDRLNELVEKFRETAQQLRDVETDRGTLRESLESSKRELSACIGRNAALYELNDEVLTRLERRGAFGPSLAAEPFTKLKRTQLENFVADHRYRAEEQRQSTLAPLAPEQQPPTP